MMITALRKGLGNLVLAADYVTRPTPLQRDSASQAQVEEEIAKLSLYQFNLCPFCIKVRRTFRRLNLPIQVLDASKGSIHRNELGTQGGKIKVPCLKVVKNNKAQWIYESNDIIQYLETRYS